MEAHLMRVDDLHRLDVLLQVSGARAFVALETELHVLGRERVAVVKRHALTQLKIVHQAIRTLAPLGGQTGRHGTVRHGFDYGIMESIQEHERGNDAGGLGRVKPGRSNGDMNGPRHLATGGALLRQRGGQMGPALMPGEHTSSATRSTEESTSGEGELRLRGMTHGVRPPVSQYPSLDQRWRACHAAHHADGSAYEPGKVIVEKERSGCARV